MEHYEEGENLNKLNDFICKDPENDGNEKFAGILSEDHPLLEKFQKSLNEHLTRIQNQLNDELHELNSSIKSKEQERDDVGCRLYDLQQEIRQQNQILDEFSTQIKDISEKRIAKEDHIKTLRKQYDEQVAISKEAENYHKERKIELMNLQTLELNMQKWAKEIEDEVVEAQRIVSKDGQDQKMLAEEKSKMDMLLFNLSSEVCKREQELNMVNEQIKEQRNMRDVLNSSVADANSDLEVLQKEQKRLAQAWNEVIIAINKRDKILFQTKDCLTKEFEKQKLVESSIEGTKTAITKEMEKNEKLELFKGRISEDLKNVKKQINKETDIISKLQRKLDEIEALTNQTENDLKSSQQEGNSLMVQYRLTQSKIDKQIQRKQKLEEEIFKFHENQLTADNESANRMKILKDMQNQRRLVEQNITMIEKQLSNMIFELEKLKGSILRLREENDRLRNAQYEIDSKASKCDQEIKEINLEIQSKTKSLDLQRQKLDELIREIGGGKEMSAVELSIHETEKRIQDINKDIQKAQEYWLSQQHKLVDLSEKRSTQINEIQLIRKHKMLIEQKSLKINGILQEKSNFGQELKREIKSLMTKLDLLSGKLFEKKKSHEKDEEDCYYAHLDFIEKLKDAEMTSLKLEQEISDLTRDIEQLKEVVLEKHHEALSWETKYKMTEEMVRWRNQEKSNDSDISHMKMEIRRMQVRYNQLKSAQNKLINDLEHCVMHREKIFLDAMYRQKCEMENLTNVNVITTSASNNSISNISKLKVRSTIKHKINEYKSKIKQIQNEIYLNEKTLNEITKECEEIANIINQKKDDYENEKLQHNLIQNEIEKNMLQKYHNLEIIIKLQHRAKRLRTLESSRVLPKQKSDTTLENELQKQNEINDNLITILQNLLNDYPEKNFFLTRILQTLQDD